MNDLTLLQSVWDRWISMGQALVAGIGGLAFVLACHTHRMKTRMNSAGRTTAERVTVSLPRDLFDWGEGERQRAHVSRSEFVAGLYRRYRETVEERRRVARYAAAYGKVPTTEAEDYLTERSAGVLFGDPPE